MDEPSSPDSVASRPIVRADARRNRQLLLEAARAEFVEHGAETSPVGVAARAGVGVGTLYRHFQSRDVLLEAVLADHFSSLQAAAHVLLGEPDPVEALRTWLRCFAEELTAIRGVAAVLKRNLLDEENRRPEVCMEMLDAWDALVARAQQTSSIRPDVNPRELLRITNAIAWATESTSGSPEEADRLLGLVIDGLRYNAGAAASNSGNT